jgi:hypothetical protein
MYGSLDENAINGIKDKIGWRFSLKLTDVDHFSELKFHAQLDRDPQPLAPVPKAGNGKIQVERFAPTLEFALKKGQRVPTVTAYGWDGVNDQLIQALLTQAFAGEAPPGADGSPTSAQANAGAEADKPMDPGVFQIHARESAMTIAGQKSQGYLLEFVLMDRWKARAFIAEAGELVLMDLPEDYHLVEPVIHGLAKEYDPDKEEVVAPDGTVISQGK